MIETLLLSSAILAIAVIGVRLDRDWIAITPLTPLGVVLFGIFTRSVFSPLLMSLESAYSYSPKSGVMIMFRNEVQMLWLVLTVFIVLPYALWGRKEKKAPKKGLPMNENAVAVFLLACGLFSLAWIYIGLITGSASREPELYAFWAQKFLKPDAVFTAFGRLRDVFYFLVPLGIYKIQKKWIKALIFTIVLLNLNAALQVGGRGIVLIPILEMYFGLFLLGLKKRVLIASSCLMLMVGLSGSQLLRGNHKIKISSIMSLTGTSQSVIANNSLVRTGLDLYGCSDAFNFTIENLNKPGAGWVRSERWLTSWLPSALRGSTKMSPRDAHIIAEQLENGTSRELAETKDYKSFNCVTFPGDLFWRWRWIGVLSGGFVFGIFYYAVTSVWRRFAALDSISGCLAFCFPASFLSLYPAGSLGETLWLWTWDIQKYIAIYLILRFLESRRLIPFVGR